MHDKENSIDNDALLNLYNKIHLTGYGFMI